MTSGGRATGDSDRGHATRVRGGKNVTSDSEIYSVPVSASTGDSPSCLGTVAQSNNHVQVIQERFVQPCQPWKTQLGFGPINIPPKNYPNLILSGKNSSRLHFAAGPRS
jgi:hypothetical protein